MEDQENEFDDFAHTTIDDANENEYVSTSTEESISNWKITFQLWRKDQIPLHNFFLCEISDIKAEIKSDCNWKTSKDIAACDDEKIELLQNQIIYLKEHGTILPWREKCNSKNQLINFTLENVFKSDIPKVRSYTKSNTLLPPNNEYRFPKR